MFVVKKASVRLEIDRLSKQYGARWVLRDIAAELEDGDVLLVTGHNGAGKSTLLRLLAGLQRPTSGAAMYSLNGTAFTPSNARSFLGMVGPDVQLYRELTASEHLRFVYDVRGVPCSEAEQRRVLAHVGLAGHERTLVGSFSSGMQQRLRYALALIGNPAVLLLDEPTTNLDAAGIALVDRIVAEQRQRGITVIATNDPRDRRYGSLQLALDKE
jgi:heme exporter protein A